MTEEQTKQLYISAGGPKDHSESEWSEIHKEIQAICAAKSDRAAANTIRWWGCWGRQYTATAFCRRVRESASRI